MAKSKRGKPVYYVTHPKNWMRALGNYSYISVNKNGTLLIRHRPIEYGDDHFILDRRHARLLAKRILQALEDTK